MHLSRSASSNSNALQSWQWTLAGLAVALTTLLALYWETVAAMASVWASSDDVHSFHMLVLPIALYFIWLRRHQLIMHTPTPTLLALPLLIIFGFAWLLAHAALIKLGEQLALVGMMQALILGFLGWRVYRTLLFPLMLLWLMPTITGEIIPDLLDLTTVLTVWGLRLVGIATTYEGTILVTDYDRYAIVEGCSARPFILGNLIICLVFAQLMFRSMGKRIVYVLAGIPVAIFANILRTTTVVAITEYSAGKYDLVADHGTYGWFIFALSIAIQMAIGYRFADSQQAPAATAQRYYAGHIRNNGRHHARLTGVLLAGLAIIVIPTVWASHIDAQAIPAGAVGNCPVDGLPGAPAVAPAWQPGYATADVVVQRRLASTGGDVDLAIVYYQTQGPGKEMIAWPNAAYDGKSWQLHQHVSAKLDEALAVPDPQAQRLRGFKRSRRLVWSWYWVDGRLTSDTKWAKILQSLAILQSGDHRSGVVMLSVDENGDPGTAEKILHRALQQLESPSILMERVAQAASPRNCP